MTVTLLDGGMGKALQEAGAPFRQPEWSALALMDDPSWVTRVHQQFVDAGAEVLITNNYAVVPFHLGDERFDARSEELVSLSGRLAREVADGAGRAVRVAGSIPPLFGSYEPERFDPERAPALLARITAALAPFVDLFVAETQSSIAEAVASVAAAAPHGRPVWVSATLDDGGGPAAAAARVAEPIPLRSGESVTALCERLVPTGTGDPASPVTAVLFNCSQPEVMRAAILEARAALPDEVAVGAYANAFEDRPEDYAANEVVLGHRTDLEHGGYEPFVESWIDAGATIVGGCCGIMPRHIAQLRALLDRRTEQST